MLELNITSFIYKLVNIMKQIISIITILVLTLPIAAQNQNEFEKPGDYPLIGDWTGEWIDPQKGHEVHHPGIAAQINIIDGNRYMIHILPELYNRATLYLDVEVDEDNQQLKYEKDGWSFVFSGDSCIGYGNLHGDKTQFTMVKQDFIPSTLGKQAPENAIQLLIGDDLSAWVHDDEKEKVTWKMEDGILETVSAFWNGGQNRKDGLGGSIRTKQKFGDLQFHMEFRYAIEPGKSGQMRGNSGLFFHGVGEVQILNSYALQGYWNEAGSIYKRHPAKVNAAGPPMYWQTYDVELIMPRFNADGDKLSEAILTVWLNGKLIHNQLEVKSNASQVSIGLQDHINCLQYRNAWAVEK